MAHMARIKSEFPIKHTLYVFPVVVSYTVLVCHGLSDTVEINLATHTKHPFQMLSKKKKRGLHQDSTHLSPIPSAYLCRCIPSDYMEGVDWTNLQYSGFSMVMYGRTKSAVTL